MILILFILLDQFLGFTLLKSSLSAPEPRLLVFPHLPTGCVILLLVLLFLQCLKKLPTEHTSSSHASLVLPLLSFGSSYQVRINSSSFYLICTFFSHFYYIETKGLTLEEMDDVFGGQSAIHDAEIMKEVQMKVAEAQAPTTKAEA
jgi:hypothetical protein